VTVAVNRRRWCITITGTGAIEGIHNKSRTNDSRGNPQRPIGIVPPAIVSVAMVPMPTIITAMAAPSRTSVAAAIMPVASGEHGRRQYETCCEKY
jgi:hypothetical protein